jgi:hypothetical protein
VEQFSAKKAQKLIMLGKAPANMRVEGQLDLSGLPITGTGLPEGLTVEVLDLSNCAALTVLPANLKVKRLILNGCRALRTLPRGFHCYELEMRNSGVVELPYDLRVDYRLNLEGSTSLKALPVGLKVGVLVLRDCVALEALPEGLDVYFLDLAGCVKLTYWPESAGIRAGCLNIRGCENLRSLPGGLSNLAWVDLAGSGVTELPASLRGVRLRWRGVQVDERIAFHPEMITAPEVLDEQNTERRRVLLERMGYDAFMAQANAKVLDQDSDPGGPRRLLRVKLPGDEPLVCVSVRCPSTGRQYLLRVPPTTRTCHQAAAWLAGFDNPADYRPIVET